MLPSAAWDPGNVVSMVPRWCKLGTCPPEAMERIYPPPSPIGNDILFPLLSPSLFSRCCTKLGITSDHSFLRMKPFILDPHDVATSNL